MRLSTVSTVVSPFASLDAVVVGEEAAEAAWPHAGAPATPYREL
jgi:hypothetical protein